jgi:uncharacterized protein (UPF0276 family)
VPGFVPGAVGLGWRPETAWLCADGPSAGVDFLEVIAEAVPRELPPALAARLDAGATVVVHGVALGLGGAEPPASARLRRLAEVARQLGTPLVSEHVAFVRGGGREVEHLLPIPRTAAVLDLLVDHVRRAQDALPVPLALEHVAAAFRWPDPGQLPEGEFLAELARRTGCRLLVDLANLHADRHNHGCDAEAFLRAIDPRTVAYLHVAGGRVRSGAYHDTHAHPVGDGPLALLGRWRALHGEPPPVLLERDAGFGSRAALEAELTAIAAVVRGGALAA